MILSLSKSLLLIKTRPNNSEILFAYVDLPDPGGPITRILGGLLGALDLNLNEIIFLSSAVMSAGVLSHAVCS